MILHLLKTDWQRLKRPVLAVWLVLLVTTLPWLLHRPDSFTGPWIEINSSQGPIPEGIERPFRSRVDPEFIRYLLAFATLLLSSAIGMHDTRWQAVSPLRPWHRLSAKLAAILTFIVAPQAILGGLILQLHGFPPGAILAGALGTVASLVLLHAAAALFAYHCGTLWTWLAGIASLLAAVIVLSPMFPGRFELVLHPFIDPWAMDRGPRYWIFGGTAVGILLLLPKIFRPRPGSAPATSAAVLALLAAGMASRRVPEVALASPPAPLNDPDLAGITPEIIPGSLRIDDDFYSTHPAGSLLLSAAVRTRGLDAEAGFVVWSAATRSLRESRVWTHAFPHEGSVTDRDALSAVLPSPLFQGPAGWHHPENQVRGSFPDQADQATAPLELRLNGHRFRYEILADLPWRQSPATTSDGEIRIVTRTLELPDERFLLDTVAQGPASGIARDPLHLTWDPHALRSYRFVLHFPHEKICVPLWRNVDQSAPIPGGGGWSRRILRPLELEGSRHLDPAGARLIILKHVPLGSIRRVLTIDRSAADPSAGEGTDWILSRNYGLSLDAYLKNHRPVRPDPATGSEAEFARYLRALSGTFYEELAVRDLAEYAPRFSPLLLSHARRRTAAMALAAGSPESTREKLLTRIREDPSQVPRLASVLLERGWQTGIRDLLVAALDRQPPGDFNWNSTSHQIAVAIALPEDPATYPGLLDFLEKSRSFAIYRTLRELPGIDEALDEAIWNITRSLSPSVELSRLRPGLIYGVFDGFQAPVAHGNPVALAKLLELWRILPSDIRSFDQVRAFADRFEPQPAIPPSLDAWRAFIEGKSAGDFTHDPLTGKWLAPSQP